MSKSDLLADLDRGIAALQRAKTNADWILQSSDAAKDGIVRKAVHSAQALGDWSDKQVEHD